MIDVQQLSKRFGRQQVTKQLSFSVRPGEVLGFLGPNGAGKSTTMRMLAGFLTPDDGVVKVCGFDVVAEPLKAKRNIGYLPEGAPAYGDMSVQQFLLFVAEARGLDKATRRDQVTSVCERLSLNEVLHRPIENLSKGFKRRVGLAQALLHDPQVLILDEPTDGLDPNQKFEVRQLIRNLSDDKIVIVSTHILEEVEALCQRVIIIHQGALVADSTPAELKATSRFNQAVELEFNSGFDRDALAVELRELEGVECVELSPENAGVMMVIPHKGIDIFNTVRERLAVLEVKPLAMSISSGRLDDVFRRVTQEASV